MAEQKRNVVVENIGDTYLRVYVLDLVEGIVRIGEITGIDRVENFVIGKFLEVKCITAGKSRDIATMFAPAFASPIEMALPSPFDAPVTMATFPVKSNKSEAFI